MRISAKKWILLTVWSEDVLPVWYHVHFIVLSLFPSLLPLVLWDCTVPRGLCCLVGAGRLAEDTSFLSLYIHAWLFSIVPLPHCTVHSELDRLSLARQWSTDYRFFFFYRDSWLTQSSIFTLSRKMNKCIGSGSDMFSSCTFRSVDWKDKAESVTYAPCTLTQSKRPLNQSRLRVQRSWSCGKMHNRKSLCLLPRFWPY